MSSKYKKEVATANKFSPPDNLDSGFTPFFKSSKYFDEKSYFDNMTTETTQAAEETIETTTTAMSRSPAPSPPYKNSAKFGEKSRVQHKPMKPYYTTYKPKQYSIKPRKYSPVKQSSSSPTSGPSFIDHWDSFNHEFPDYNSMTEDIVEIGLKTPEHQGGSSLSFQDWDRRYAEQDAGRHSGGDHRTRHSSHRGTAPVSSLGGGGGHSSAPELEEDSVGFMDTRPFTLPSFRGGDWARRQEAGTQLQRGGGAEPEPDNYAGYMTPGSDGYKVGLSTKFRESYLDIWRMALYIRILLLQSAYYLALLYLYFISTSQ